MNYVSFNDYLKAWRSHGLTDQQAAMRLLLALRDPANARHVRGTRIESEEITPTRQEEGQRRHALERRERIGRWLECATAWRTHQRLDTLQRWVSTRTKPLSPERWGAFLWTARRLQADLEEFSQRSKTEGRLRQVSARRRAALEQAWKRLNAIAEPEARWNATTSETPEVVPAGLWGNLNHVNATLESHWYDDENEPEEGVSVDWRAGMLTFWDMFGNIEYCNLEVHRLLARPTRAEVEERIRESSTSDQRKFLDEHGEFIRESGLTIRGDFRPLWVDIKYSGKRKKSPGRPPNSIGRNDAAAEL